ncbi:phosphotransferase [Achromobacter xylosoxidans]
MYAPTTYSVRREAQVLQWLAGHLNVPEVVRVADNADGDFMLTRRMPGVPLQARMGDADTAIGLFGEALRQLRAVPADDCPFDAGAPMRLRELDYLLARGLCADDHDLTQWPGLATPADLVARLHATLPREDPAFSHGDLCDNNVFVDERDRLHFIDLGRGGVADRWQDVAFIHRNLRDISEDAAATFSAPWTSRTTRPSAASSNSWTSCSRALARGYARIHGTAHRPWRAAARRRHGPLVSSWRLC